MHEDLHCTARTAPVVFLMCTFEFAGVFFGWGLSLFHRDVAGCLVLDPSQEVPLVDGQMADLDPS